MKEVSLTNPHVSQHAALKLGIILINNDYNQKNKPTLLLCLINKIFFSKHDFVVAADLKAIQLTIAY